MAEEKIAIDLLINSTASATSIKELKKSIKELESAALAAANAGDDKLFRKLTKAAGEAKAKFKDFKDEVNAFDPDKKAAAFARVGSGLASGFQAATGAMALFGVESEEVQKTLLKVQAATALAQGVQSVMELGDAFKILGNIIRANPLFALASVIIAISSALWGFKDSIFGVSEEQKKLNDELEKQHEITEQLQKQTQQRIELLQAQGKSEEEILKLKKELIDQQIKEVQVSMLVQQQKIKEKLANDSLGLSIIKLTQSDTAYKLAKAASVIEEIEQLKKLDEQRKDFAHQLQVINAQQIVLEEKKNEQSNANYKKFLDEKKKLQDLEIQEQQDILDIQLQQQVYYDKLLKDIEDEKLKKRKEENLKQEEENLNNLKIRQEEEKKINDERIAEEKRVSDAKKSIQQDTFSTLASLGQIFINNAKQLEKFNKGLAVSQILIDTAQAISALVKNSEANPANAFTGGLAGVAQFASGIARILANVAKAKQLLSKSGGAPNISLQGVSGGGGAAPIPNINPISNNSTLLNPDGTVVNQNQNNQPLKAYVVENEITASQNKISSIESKTKFG